MRKRCTYLVWLVWIVFLVEGGPPSTVNHLDQDVYARGRALTNRLLSGKLDQVYQIMPSELRTTVGGREGLALLIQQLEQNAGKETGVAQEAAYHGSGLVDYYRISRFSKLPKGTITIRWIWQPDGTIVGAQISPTPDPAFGYSIIAITAVIVTILWRPKTLIQYRLRPGSN
jgi:hypothetical protein